MSILPDIWQVAAEYHLGNYKTVAGRPTERRFNCPFCNDRHYHLYLNGEKNTFNCYKCGEKGGVLRFIALLTGKSELQVLEEIKRELPKEPSRRKKRHPAEGLSAVQLKEMGFYNKPNWKSMRKRDQAYAKRTLDWVWSEWQAFLEYELCQAYKWLLIGIACGRYLGAVERVLNRSREIGYDLLSPILNVYGRGNDLPQWAAEGFLLAQLYLTPQKQPRRG